MTMTKVRLDFAGSIEVYVEADQTDDEAWADAIGRLWALTSSARVLAATSLTGHEIVEREHKDTCTGLHDPASPSCFDGVTLPDGARIVERCDELSPFDSDEDAAKASGLSGTWVECANDGAHYLVGCTPGEAGVREIT